MMVTGVHWLLDNTGSFQIPSWCHNAVHPVSTFRERRSCRCTLMSNDSKIKNDRVVMNRLELSADKMI